MCNIFAIHWEKVRDTVDRIEAQLVAGDIPSPTSEMCEFLIVGEDHRFYNHFGVDLIAVCRALWKTFVFNERQGASTIAMQLVRTITGHYERTFRRKLLEMVLAIRLTHYIDRERLPALYLCAAYYGWRMNNFREACSRLKLKLNSINEMQAAKIVARLKYPEPSVFSIKRSQQIEHRARHLVMLRHQVKYHSKISYGSIQNPKSIVNSY